MVDVASSDTIVEVVTYFVAGSFSWAMARSRTHYGVVELDDVSLWVGA